MSGKQFNFEETIGYTRKTFGAKPDKITDSSQVPTVKIPDGPLDSNNVSNLFNETPTKVDSQKNNIAELQNTNEKKMPVTESASGINQRPHIRPVPHNSSVKIVSSEGINSHLLLNMKLKTSVDCLKMYYSIYEVSNSLNTDWVEITRTDFEKYGVRGGKIVDARLEGIERELFEFREIKEISKATNKEYVKGYEYRIIK